MPMGGRYVWEDITWSSVVLHTHMHMHTPTLAPLSFSPAINRFLPWLFLGIFSSIFTRRS